jgi:type VI secretion system protein ImpF
MARDEASPALLPSILDRLMDPTSRGTFRQGQDLDQVVDSIRRDLEELLNARPPYMEVPEHWPEVKNSLMTFGLPDLISVTIKTDSDKEELARLVESIVARFEPRLRNIRAILMESPGEEHRDVRFHIEAEINVDPAPKVTFETVLELTTGQAKIEAAV